MNSKEFARRRKQLMRMVGEGGIAILPAAPVRTRSRDVEYRYRQDSDFYYLTGFAEPEAVAVLVPGRDSGEFLLFCRERDTDKEQWDGRAQGRMVRSRVRLPTTRFRSMISTTFCRASWSPAAASTTRWACTPILMRASPTGSIRCAPVESRGVHTPQEFVALDHLLHDMRLYKSRAEIAAMRKSANVAVKAHRACHADDAPGAV